MVNGLCVQCFIVSKEQVSPFQVYVLCDVLIELCQHLESEPFKPCLIAWFHSVGGWVVYRNKAVFSVYIGDTWCQWGEAQFEIIYRVVFKTKACGGECRGCKIRDQCGYLYTIDIFIIAI